MVPCTKIHGRQDLYIEAQIYKASDKKLKHILIIRSTLHLFKSENESKNGSGLTTLKTQSNPSKRNIKNRAYPKLTLFNLYSCQYSIMEFFFKIIYLIFTLYNI